MHLPKKQGSDYLELEVSNSDSARVNSALMKRETLALLRQFTLASNDEDLIRATLGAICSYTRSLGGFYVSCLHGLDNEDPVQVAAHGVSNGFIEFDEIMESLTGTLTLGRFRSWIANFGWIDTTLPCKVVTSSQNFVGATLYCLPVRNLEHEIIGFIGLQNFADPFSDHKLEGILVLLTAIDARLKIAQGTFSSQSVIINRIIHDVNGGLSVIGLQNELLNLELGGKAETQAVRQRIKTGLQKVDEAVIKLQDFSGIFFTNEVDTNAISVRSILNAAMVSVPISAGLKSKIHVSYEGIEHESANVDALVMYWLYRTVIAAWTNVDLWNPSDPTEMFVDLEYGTTKPECVNLVLSRDVSCSIDLGMKGLFGFSHGLSDKGLVLMSQAFALDYWVRLFGGSTTFSESNGVRRITVTVPLAS